MTVCSPDLKEERRLRSQGYESVAGLDEVGRGAWAGPLTVGVAVVRPRVQLRSMPAWLRDSKMLSEARPRGDLRSGRHVVRGLGGRARDTGGV